MITHFDPIPHIRFLQFKCGFSEKSCQNIENGNKMAMDGYNRAFNKNLNVNE